MTTKTTTTSRRVSDRVNQRDTQHHLVFKGKDHRLHAPP